MATTKFCYHVHPKKPTVVCHGKRNHVGNCYGFDENGKRYEWRDPNEGPDSLKSLLRF
jgi:hypothetical protein